MNKFKTPGPVKRAVPLLAASEAGAPATYTGKNK